jgi:hypothetical protein
MRLFACCFVLAFSNLLIAQISPADFRGRYGEPDRERFLARPGIAVEVEYGADHLACMMLIGTPEKLLHENNSFIPASAATEILEEVVPLESRGNQINSILEQFGCATARRPDYVNVTITRTSDECHSPDSERATVRFTRDACQKYALVPSR